MATTEKPRLHELDSLRGLAVLLVLVYHYTTRYDELYGHASTIPFRFVESGALLMFVLSGFVITMTLGRTAKLSDFVVARAARLYPAYWVAVVLTFTVVRAFGLPSREVSAMDAAANLTMVQYWAGIPYIDGAYWTLTTQLVFYALMVVPFVMGRMHQLVAFSAIWLAGAFVLRGAEAYLGVDLHWTIRSLAMLDHGNLFVAGIAFVSLQRSRDLRYAAVVLACLAFDGLFRTAQTFVMCAIYYAAFALLAYGRLSWLGVRPLVFIGTISYSLYLFHQNLGYVVIRELYGAGVTSPWIILGLPTVLSVSLASLTYTFIERPAVNSLRAAWRRSSHARRREQPEVAMAAVEAPAS